MLDNMAVKNRVYGLIELDVTKVREYIRGHKEKTGETQSFTGWIIKCIGQAVSEDEEVEVYRKGKSKGAYRRLFDCGMPSHLLLGPEKS
jgi:hypothetical protein